MEQTGQPPSYDELAVLVVVLRARLEEVEARADRLEAENAELRGKAGKNSRAAVCGRSGQAAALLDAGRGRGRAAGVRRAGDDGVGDRAVALRLRDRREEFLHFTTDFRVAFSNNCAEQAIRMIKIKTKVSGGFRTLIGAQTFLAIRGYIATGRKNGLRAAGALRTALLGSPWMPPGYAAT